MKSLLTFFSFGKLRVSQWSTLAEHAIWSMRIFKRFMNKINLVLLLINPFSNKDLISIEAKIRKLTESAIIRQWQVREILKRVIIFGRC